MNIDYSQAQFISDLDSGAVREVIITPNREAPTGYAKVRLVKQCTEPESFRPPVPQHFQQIAQSSAGVHNILHHQHILVLERLVQIFYDLHYAAGLCILAVAGYGHKIQ